MKRRWLILMATALVFAFVLACKKTESTTDTSSTSTTTTDTSATTTTAATPSGTSGTSDTTSTGSTGGTVSTLDAKDKEFAMKAAEGGMTEVALGNMAASKGEAVEVKSFGSQMVKDHGAAGDELKTLATTKGLALPTGLGAEGQATNDKLAKLSGKDFDKAYVSDMVKDHEKDVHEFEKASKELKDPDLKAWATKTLPVIQGHLKMIKEIQSKMK